MSIKLKLEGFDDLLTQIEKAGGSIDVAAETCLKKSAEIMESELASEMGKAGVESSLINRMDKSEVFVDGNAYVAKVGYKKGAYNPNDPSDGYKVVFLNYGTPHRSLHGKIVARGFIQKAKKKAAPRIKKVQAETLNEILKEL